MGFDISLSASKLNLLKECRRCFYDANVLKIERPRGIFPSLPGGVDRVMKEYCDQFRLSLPPELSGIMTGKLWGNADEIKKLRHWQSGLKTQLQILGKTVSIIGALDDLILESDSTYSPYDTKTKGSIPSDDGSKYYGLQQDIYALLLEKNGFKTSGKGYLDYWFPVTHVGGSMTFDHKLFTLGTDPSRAIATITDAVDLMSREQPAFSMKCEFCRFAQARIPALTMAG